MRAGPRILKGGPEGPDPGWVQAQPPPPRRPPVGLALTAVGGLLLAARLAAIHTAPINWDEFVLMTRAGETVETGVLRDGGRPGLGTLLVAPLVQGCRDEIRVLHRARLLWTLFCVAYLVGVGLLVARLQPDPSRRLADALWAVALLAAVPAFLEWSLQVRTDPIALAGGTWAAWALLASRATPVASLAAGALLGVGYLASQKVFYLAALAGLLAAFDLLRARELRWRRELLRGLGMAAGYALVLGGFQLGIGAFVETPEASPARHYAPAPALVKGAVTEHFGFMRETIGFSQMRALLPSLVPHGLWLLGLALASLLAWRRRRALAGLGLAWATLGLGLAVLLFHGSRFSYFWMTLGLFPAVGLAVARGEILALLLGDAPRPRRLVGVGLGLLLALPAALHMGRLLVDRQAVQRDSLAFVQRNFASEAAGFHPEGALFCREAGQPLGLYLSQKIYRTFERPERDHSIAQLRKKFYREEVRFLVQSFRLNQFPVELRRFWADHYLPYRQAVFVAGCALSGKGGEAGDCELVVDGSYRWLPREAPLSIEIGGRRLAAGEVLELGRGSHPVRFVEDVPAGALVLALAEPPGRAPLPFYESP